MGVNHPSNVGPLTIAFEMHQQLARWLHIAVGFRDGADPFALHVYDDELIGLKKALG